MELNLPSERLSYWYQFSNFHKCCLEREDLLQEGHVFVINLGEYEDNFVTAFNIGREFPKPSSPGVADYYLFQTIN